MAHVREPTLEPTPITELRPTQITVGMREVEEKRRRWGEMTEKKKRKFLAGHMIPVILGPGKRRYIIDHHHLARALYDEGEKSVLVTVVSDLHQLDPDAFWTYLDHRALVHPYDAKGRRHTTADLPKNVARLADDPFRSLAGEIRRAGGFAKDTTPYSEFLWADFLRRRLSAKRVRRDFSLALEEGLALAKSREADYLPGWCGAHA